MTRHHQSSSHLFLCAVALGGTCLPLSAQTTAPNEWTWVGGSNSVTNPNGQPGLYGIQGTPATADIPGGRDSAASWTDHNGNFWLFGGEGADANGNFGELNDLWEFKPSTQEWTWVGGSSSVPATCAGSATVACGQPGVYGMLGSAALANVPGGRSFASYWTDSNGNFWLFAGYGFDASQKIGELNDLWEFNPTTKQWTWMGGSSSVGSNYGQPGTYGALGTAASANAPGGRDSASGWVDKNGQLWLFGGEGIDAQGDYGELDDLWKFEPSNGEWAWMGGSATVPSDCASTSFGAYCGWPATYAALGTPAPGINPGSRLGAAGWTDADGNLWLFGGTGTVFNSGCFFCQEVQYDLWSLNPATDEWTWAGGNSTNLGSGLEGIYGTEGTPSIANLPSGRAFASSWNDTAGNFWLFGGGQPEPSSSYGNCNDIWVFETAAGEWAWMNGSGAYLASCSDFPFATYGTLGVPAATNVPSGRDASASWIDLSGNLWLFGGYGEATGSGGPFVDLNDLWIYAPIAPAPEPSFELVASPNPINIGAIGAGTPAITTGTVTVNVLAADGFDSPVTLSIPVDTCNASGTVQTCATGSFSPATITGAGSSTLTVSVTGAAVSFAQVLPLTITATSGSISQSIFVIVDVTAVNTPIGPVPAPSFSVPAGTYSTPQIVTITDIFGGGGVYVYYTTDGSTPTMSSQVYFDPIAISSTTTLKAIGVSAGLDQSAESSATYTIVAPQPNFTITGSSVSVAPGATAGNTSTIALTPSDGFTGTISLTCEITPAAASDPATCSITPTVTISGSTAQTASLTVNSTSATSAFNQTRWSLWPLARGTVLGCILLIGIPAQWRKWWSTLGMLLLLIFVTGGQAACGGGGGVGGGGGGNPGTSPGVYIITVTGTSGTITETGTVSLTVL